jgi:hypothetical protein
VRRFLELLGEGCDDERRVPKMWFFAVLVARVVVVSFFPSVVVRNT